jgi:hypothetical protein
MYASTTIVWSDRRSSPRSGSMITVRSHRIHTIACLRKNAARVVAVAD